MFLSEWKEGVTSRVSVKMKEGVTSSVSYQNELSDSLNFRWNKRKE